MKNAGQFTKVRVAKAYKRKEIIRYRGERFLSFRAAKRHAHKSQQFLNDHEKASPLLGGRDLRTKPFKNGLGREEKYYAESSLDELISAYQQLSSNPEVPDYCAYEEAPDVAGASIATVKKLKNRGCKRFRIKKFKMKDVLAKDVRGNVIWKPYFPIAPLKRYRDCCEKALKVPEDKMTVEDAAKYLDVAEETVISWIRKGKLAKSGNIQNGFLLDRKAVEAFAEIRKKGPQPYTDARGKWYIEGLAEDKYPNAKGFMLRRYRNKPCPQLNRDILHAQQIPWQVGMKKSRHGRPWAYLDKDLERLTPAESPENFLRNWWSSNPQAGRSGLVPENGQTAMNTAPLDTSLDTSLDTQKKSQKKSRNTKPANPRDVPKVMAILRAFAEKRKQGMDVQIAAEEIAQERTDLGMSKMSKSALVKTLQRYKHFKPKSG